MGLKYDNRAWPISAWTVYSNQTRQVAGGWWDGGSGWRAVVDVGGRMEEARKATPPTDTLSLSAVGMYWEHTR